MFLVENLEADVINYEGHICFQVLAEYVNSDICNIHVKRIDTITNEGWEDDLQIFIHDHIGNSKTIHVGPTSDNLSKKVIEKVCIENSVMICSQKKIDDSWIPNYKPFRKFEHYPIYVDLANFNQLFDSDIVELPSCLYAMGLMDGGAYIYHDSYGQYNWKYEIEHSIDFLLSVVFSKYNDRPPENFFCLICALDGYIEACFPHNRSCPKKIGDIEYRNKINIDISNFHDNEYPIFYNQKYVLGQSTRNSIPFSLPIVDRYYLYLNRYNQYRSIHRGIPFISKIPKLVYAGNDRGSLFNFMTDKKIKLSQRAFFASDSVNKTNVFCPPHIPREDMINYKYILDIDGNACTWDATAWKLNSGSVIFKPESDWKQWFYDEYTPWSHFVPIKDDFKDLQEKIDWCEENPKKCLEMVKNCKSLFQKIYHHPNVVKEMEKVVDILVDSYKNNH